MSDNKHKTLEENKAIVRRWLEEVWNGGRVELIDELAHDTFVVQYFPMPELSPINLQTYKQFHPLFMAAFPDLHMAIDALIAEGDCVTARVTQTGTHTKEFMGIPPSGKRVTLPCIAIYRIEGGKLAEAWAAETPWPIALAELAATAV